MDDETSSSLSDPLQILGRLAAEYHQKFADLESFTKNCSDEELVQQLGALGEHTTDRFRGAQQALFALLPLSSMAATAKQNPFEALTVLCRCFDEMRILCQVLLERLHQSEK